MPTDIMQTMVSSTQAFLISERAAAIFGWDNQTALGKTIKWPLHENDGRPRGSVIGVYRDFHVSSLYEPMKPSILAVWNEKLLGFAFRYRPEMKDEVVEHLRTVWTRYNRELPFRYVDLDHEIDRRYWQEHQLMDITHVFGLIAGTVACLGLLGLTAFTTQQRMKEIGVRKVLGGSSASLIRLLTSEVVLLVVAANVLAAPFGYVLASKWLATFHYRSSSYPPSGSMW